jgi:plastocyanin
MKRLVYSVLLSAVAVLALAPIGAAQSGQQQGVQVAPNQSTETVPIMNGAFGPAQLQVTPGTTVTWINADSVPHRVTADDGSFDSGDLNYGESFSVRFDGTGTLRYHSALQPDMQGSVSVVGDSAAQPSTAEQPATETKQPTNETTQPAAKETTQPAAKETTQPAAKETAQPTSGANQPITGTFQPGTSNIQTTNDATQPTNGAAKG